MIGGGGGGGRAGARGLHEINVTPLVDVMLVLLVVFMVTAPLLATGLKVELPKVQAANTPVPDERIVLSITRDERMFLGEREITAAPARAARRSGGRRQARALRARRRGGALRRGRKGRGRGARRRRDLARTPGRAARRALRSGVDERRGWRRAVIAALSGPPRPRTPPAYVAVATFAALGAQAAFVVVFAYQRPPGRADLAPLARDEVAVAIEPISTNDLPLLKYGDEHATTAGPSPQPSPNPNPAPNPGIEPTPSPNPTPQPQPTPQPNPQPTPEPTPQPTPEPLPQPTPGPTPGTTPTIAEAQAGSTSSSASSSPIASQGPGSPLGSDAGTETDPLRGRIAATYRGQLDGWFSARFHIRGKLPFEQLERLAASVVVTVADRRVVGFSITAPSGDPIFDGQLRADLAAIQASGALLPAPPPTHPELLGGAVSLRFACATRAYCE
jgi:outer membrane biosynthesis protein TonB